MIQKKIIGESKNNIIINSIIILSILLRMMYIIITPYNVRQHDLEINGKYGGLDYINTIFDTYKLPQSNKGQLYHPPLYYISSAIWMKILNLFTNDANNLYEGLQWLTLLYSILLVIIIYKILKELNVKDKYKIFILFIIAIHPTLILLSGTINNDGLSIFLIFYTIFRLMRWYNNRSAKNTLVLAMITGLSVMTKTSGAICALPIIYVFIKKFYEEFKNVDTKEERIKLFKLYFFISLMFGIVSLPIGLWYNIRNLILFKQPILYIWDTKNKFLYIGNYSIWERFIIPSIKEISEVYIQYANKDHNVIAFLIKNSLYGEYQYANNGILLVLAKTAVILNCFIGLTFIVTSVVAIIKNKNDIWYKTFLILFIFNIISYISMNIKLPYGCSMDYRYIISTLFINLYFITEILKKFKNIKISQIIYESLLYVMTIAFIISDIVILSSPIM